MSKKDEALKLALEALREIERLPGISSANLYARRALKAIEALAEQPAKEKAPQSANCEAPGWISSDHARGDDCTTEQPAQQEPDRVKFERHWRKTRGEKKANRELPRHPLQPQTYIQDSANRHWVTWQAAVRSVSPPASKMWVGLTPEERQACTQSPFTSENYLAIEAKLKEKNA